jgi:hypothetical protein
MRLMALLWIPVTAVMLLAGGAACSFVERGSPEPRHQGAQEETTHPDTTDAPDTATEAAASDERPGAEETQPESRRASKDSGRNQTNVLAKDQRDVKAAYDMLTDGTGAVSLEVPSEWEHVTGAHSEIGPNWSNFSGMRITSSITTAPDLNAWHNTGGVPGTYAVASRTLAQGYTDDDLVALGPNNFSSACEAASRHDFHRAPYSGRMQTWKGCYGDSNSNAATLAVAPEGRQCVVLLQVITYGQQQVEVGQHIVDSFEAECGLVQESTLASPSASASASTSASASVSAESGSDLCHDGVVGPGDEECPFGTGSPTDWESSQKDICEDEYGEGSELCVGIDPSIGWCSYNYVPTNQGCRLISDAAGSSSPSPASSTSSPSADGYCEENWWEVDQIRWGMQQGYIERTPENMAAVEEFDRRCR